ncbi:MAG: LysM peptidoglycan-binding domain-containing protein [Clostridiales bacterium]|nr:LysM peptidoglycan-binding domain-containing protein [Clostridiales bacterium]
MQIYVVAPGDSLYNIARAYNTSVNAIVESNQLPFPNQLVVGQALVIPIVGNFYTVVRGDSLWSIARRINMNYLELAQINNINPNSTIYPGLRLYIPPRQKTSIVSNAYAEPLGGQASQALLDDTKNAAPALTYIAPFSYQIRNDGSLQPLNINGFTQIAQQYNNSLMMVITNIQDGQFDGELARQVLESIAVQNLLLDNIIAEANRIGLFSDIHFDFEFIPGNLRDLYTNFIRLAVERLHAEGYLVSVALAPKTSDQQAGQWYEAHDYNALGNLVDFVVIMTYEWGYSSGPPLPVSPINLVEQVLRYAITEMPAQKILMGQNLYGYDWRLPYVQGQQIARAISPQFAISLARQYNAAILYDNVAQAPYFYYTDNNGIRHIVWFEDARSIQAKFDLIKRLNLRGISYWKLGLPFPQNWLLLADNFNITKY